MGKDKGQAIADACKEIAAAKLLILFSILAVFVPSLFMNGGPKGDVYAFVIGSWFCYGRFIPFVSNLCSCLANWMMKGHVQSNSNTRFERLKIRYQGTVTRLSRNTGFITLTFSAVSIGLVIAFFLSIGTELFPEVDTGQTQIRLRLPVGTRLERTEDATRKLLELSSKIAGKENIEITSAFVGTQPSSFPVNYIYLWTGGPHESVTKIKLSKGSIEIEDFKEQLRDLVKKELPKAMISFEPGDIASQVLNMGTSNPIQIAVVNRNLEQGKGTAKKIVNELSGLPYMRDIQIANSIGLPRNKN
jgi:multidrug efflux pump subunit AcrB